MDVATEDRGMGLVERLRLGGPNAAEVAGQAADEIERLREVLADHERVHNDHHRLVREVDVLLNGVGGAAPQASLCDIVAQLADWRRKQTAENE